MHMADALISPVVGGVMMATTGGIATYSIKKIKEKNEFDEKKIPLMGVMGAFVFAAQMINFTIPGTGSSGHLAGGMLLAILLGPYAGFLTMISILLIQALFFADGGLLALGCNVFNLGFYTCFIAYPYIYKRFMRKDITSKKILIASVISSVTALQAGAFSVVLQTLMSGKTQLPFKTFVLFMQPIHLAIGLVEGLVTAAVVTFIWRYKPDILQNKVDVKTQRSISFKKVLTGFIILTVAVGGMLSLFASDKPDGLEWSMEKTMGTAKLKTVDGIYQTMEKTQRNTAFLPDYGFKENKDEGEAVETKKTSNSDFGTSLSGVIGGILIFVLMFSTGVVIKMIKRGKI